MTAERIWSWLLTPPALAGVVDPFAIVYAVVFVAGFVLSAYAAGPGGAMLRARIGRSLDIDRWAKTGMGIFGAGLVFLGARLLQINPMGFGAPIWMVGATLVLLVALIRLRRSWRAGAATEAPERVEHHPLDRAGACSA
ncbi:MAG: hypothetical protein IT338_08385 [Thermomicrobiales bacterium]|nr:hypothetical protein [Thermomicrobiales bacterium]